jgi:hypothetical protein
MHVRAGYPDVVYYVKESETNEELDIAFDHLKT